MAGYALIAPITEGKPFQPTVARRRFRRTAHGRASGEVLHERLHRPRPLFASRQAYYPVHRVCDDCSQSYSILSDLSIPFPRKFLRFFNCLAMSTKCLPKKAGKRWETGLFRFSIFWVSTRCLPRVLFQGKSTLFYLLLAGFPYLFRCVRGVIQG